MRVRWSALVCVVAFVSSSLGQEKFSIQEKEAAPPKEAAAGIAKLLSPKSVQFLDGGSKEVAQVWLVSEVPSNATPEQIKNGITYREVKQGELLGVIRFEKEWSDFRKQRVPAGVYTLRLGYQPQDGDHMGMGEFQEYVVLIEATKDTTPGPMDTEAMVKMSMKSIKTGHPAVAQLVPTPAKGKEVELVTRPRGQWVVNVRRDIAVSGKKTGTVLGIGLTLEGHVAE